MEMYDNKILPKNHELELTNSSDICNKGVTDILEGAAEEIQAGNNEHKDPLPLANNFSDIDLSTCRNVQIGTKIITSNLTVIDQSKSPFQGIKKNQKSRSAFGNLTGDDDIYCQLACKICHKNFWAKIIVIIMLTIISLFVIAEIVSNNNARGTEKVTSATEGQLTTETKNSISNKDISEMPGYNGTWFVTRQQWGAQPAIKCDTNLTTTNRVKIMTTYIHCDTFSTCQRSMLDRTNSLNFGPDLYYHFGISENGVIYEGLSTKCETRPAYRDCNNTFLIVLLFFGSHLCLDTYQVQKQVNSFNKVIKYNQNNGVLSNDSLTISLFATCFRQYSHELKKFHADVRRYNVDVLYSC